MNRRVITAWTLLLLALSVLAAPLMVFALPYPSARALLDLIAKDGSLDLFSPALYAEARQPALALAFVLLVGALFLVFRREWSLRWIERWLPLPGRFAARLGADARAFFADLRLLALARPEVVLLGGLMALALAARIAFIMRPFGHDEAYTVSVFAASPLRESLSDYFLPNNHLFHTLLVHIAYLLFGYDPWAVRLPAFLAGAASIPLIYLLARRLHGKLPAAASAAAAAALPALVDLATNARGYTLVIVFTLLLLLLAVYLRRRANRFGWLLFAACAGLGFYTIPVFAFAFAAVLAWMGLMWLLGDVDFRAYGSRWGYVRWAAVCGVVIAALVFVLYTPVFLRSGVRSVLPAPVREPQPFAVFVEDARVRLVETVQTLLTGMPPALGWLLGLGVVLSIAPYPVTRCAGGGNAEVRAPRTVRAPLIAAALGSTFVLIFLLRAPPFARFLTYLFPLALIWSAAGWFGLLRAARARTSGRARLRLRRNLEPALAGLVILAALTGAAARAVTSPEAGFRATGETERVTRYLIDNLQPQDLVIVGATHDAPIWYYARLHGLSMDHFKRELPFFRAFLIIDPALGETVESVMADAMPDTFFFDLTTAKVVYQSGSIKVLELIPDAELIRREYGVE